MLLSKDFIIDLPKPPGYYGAEELFGISDGPDTEWKSGLDILKNVTNEDLDMIDHAGIPESLKTALLDFIIGGAARAYRGQGEKPATMLVHTSHLVAEQRALTEKFRQHFIDVRNEWRYQKKKGLQEILKSRWETEFRRNRSDSILMFRLNQLNRRLDHSLNQYRSERSIVNPVRFSITGANLA
jgi:hypothetical protein